MPDGCGCVLFVLCVQFNVNILIANISVILVLSLFEWPRLSWEMNRVKCYICGITALSLVTLGIPDILYVPSVSHVCYLQGVACDGALREPPPQVSMQVFPQPGRCGMSCKALLGGQQTSCFLYFRVVFCTRVCIAFCSYFFTSSPKGLCRNWLL